MLAIICLQYLDSSSVPILAHNDLDNVAKDEDVDTDKDADEYDSDCYDNRNYYAEEDKKRHQDVQELKLNHPLLDYATNNFSYHVLNTGPKDVSVFEALDSYLVPTKPVFNSWLLMNWDSPRHGKVTSLHLAVLMGLNAYVDHLITAGAPVDARSADGRTVLSYAAEKGLVDIAKLLLEHGADPDADDRIGLKPLHYSATGNHVGVVKLLLATGVHPLTKKTRPTPELMNECYADDRGETPLEYACSRGHTEIIMEFIKYLDPEDLCRCLAWTARSRKSDAVEAILKTGKAPVNVLVSGTTALMTAAAGFEKDMIEVLLKYGADPNIRCELGQGRTAEISFDSVVKFESDTTTGPTSMHAFAGFFGQHGFYGDRKKGEDCLQLLLGAGGDVNAKTKGGLSPLHYACRQHFGDQCVHEKTKVILADLLLIHGADPNAATDSGTTALHEASPNCPGLVDILVRHGANVNARNNDGQTPLQTMMQEASWKKSKPEAFLKLLKHGADCNAVDNSGCTVIHGAFRGMDKIGKTELFKAFIEAGADLNKKTSSGTAPLLLLKESRYSNAYTEGIHADTEATLSMLVDAGLDLDARDSHGQSILFKLVEREQTNMQGLATFLKLGCSVAARDHKGATILHHCIRVDVPLQVFQFLVEAGADPTLVDYAGNTIIHEAAKTRWARQNQDYSQKFKILVDLGVPTDSKNNAGQTPLHLACAWPSDNSNRKLDFLDLLLNGDIGPKSEVNAVDNKGAGPIHYAASVSEFHVGRLLRAGADSTLLTYKQISPLHIAARACQSNVIGLLLSEYQKRGSLVHLIDLKDANTRTALHYSCRSGRPESVRYLLANGANHSSTDRQGRTPLHAVAEFSEEKAYWPSRVDADRIRPAHILITPADILGTDTPAIAHWGRSGTERNVEIIDMLVQVGADLEARAGVSEDNPGMTAMDLAVSTSCTEMVNELRRRGMKATDPFEESMVPLPRGIKEAKLLLGHVYPQSARGRGPGGPTTGSRVNSKSHAAKFERLLQLRDYDLFKEFAKCGADLKAPGENWNETGLHKLVKWGHASLLECFAEEASQVDSAEWMNEKSYPGTLLSHACERELPSLDVIKVLVEKAKVDVNQISNLYGAKTALHWLAFGSHFWNSEALEYLLNNGADIEAVNARGETPLMVAVSAEHPNGFWKEETIRVLLEHGANPNVVDVEGKSCLNKSDRPNVTRMLVQRGADIMVGKPPVLTSAVESMDVETVTVLLEAGANPNLLPRTSQPDLARRSWDYHEPRYPLHEAARPNVKEAPPLGWSRMRTMMTRLLLKYGADPFAAYDDGTNVLQCLIEEHGEIEHFWELPGIDIERQGQGGRTPLISTCYPQVPPHPRIYDRTPKPKATGMPDDALVLLDKGADWNATDDMGRSALHWLCTMPDELDDSHRIVFTALTQRPPGLIHRRDKDGFKPFQLAVKNSHIWAADALIKLGADPKEADPDGNTALHYLAAELCGEKTKAAKAAERFRQYLSLDLPIENRNKVGETPLFKFISTSWEGAMENDISHRKAFSLFANAGADVFVRNNQGETLLHVTAKRWYKTERVEWDQRMDMLEIFQDLMELGLDPRAEDGRMRTAIDIAVASGHQFIVDLFREKDKN